MASATLATSPAEEDTHTSRDRTSAHSTKSAHVAHSAHSANCRYVLLRLPEGWDGAGRDVEGGLSSFRIAGELVQEHPVLCKHPWPVGVEER